MKTSYYKCNSCEEEYSPTKKGLIFGVMKESNGRHITRENPESSESHICLKCVKSINNPHSNFIKD